MARQATLTMTSLSVLLLGAPVSAQTALDPASRAALDSVIDRLTRQEFLPGLAVAIGRCREG